MPTPATGSKVDIFFQASEAYVDGSAVTFANEVETYNGQWRAKTASALLAFAQRSAGTMVITLSGTDSFSTAVGLFSTDTAYNRWVLTSATQMTGSAWGTTHSFSPSMATGVTTILGHSFGSSGQRFGANGGSTTLYSQTIASGSPTQAKIGLSNYGDWVFDGTVVRITCYEDADVVSEATLQARTQASSSGGGGGGGVKESLIIAVGDETSAITTGTGKVRFRMPYAFTLQGVRASLTTASSSGLVTVDVNEAGTSLLSTKLTIDASEKTSQTAATPAVISDASLADDAEITIDIDAAGTGATGLKVTLIGVQA